MKSSEHVLYDDFLGSVIILSLPITLHPNVHSRCTVNQMSSAFFITRYFFLRDETDYEVGVRRSKVEGLSDGFFICVGIDCAKGGQLVGGDRE